MFFYGHREKYLTGWLYCFGRASSNPTRNRPAIGDDSKMPKDTTTNAHAATQGEQISTPEPAISTPDTVENDVLDALGDVEIPDDTYVPEGDESDAGEADNGQPEGDEDGSGDEQPDVDEQPEGDEDNPDAGDEAPEGDDT